MNPSTRRVRVRSVAGEGDLLLQGDVAHRLVRVLRLEAGAAVTLFDGQGQSRAAVITHAHPREVRLRWDGPAMQHRRGRGVWLAVAIPKGKRAEVLVEKLTELGIAGFTPLLAEHGVVRPDADGGKLQRWDLLAEEAARQCRRDDVMAIEPPCALHVWLASEHGGAVRLHAHPGAASHGARDLDALLGTSGDTSVAIGPEGGWSPTEIQQLEAAGSRPVHLGERILRTETAAIVLATLVQAVLHELG